jgi:hypothetical protein
MHSASHQRKANDLRFLKRHSVVGGSTQYDNAISPYTLDQDSLDALFHTSGVKRRVGERKRLEGNRRVPRKLVSSLAHRQSCHEPTRERRREMCYGRRTSDISPGWLRAASRDGAVTVAFNGTDIVVLPDLIRGMTAITFRRRGSNRLAARQPRHDCSNGTSCYCWED